MTWHRIPTALLAVSLLAACGTSPTPTSPVQQTTVGTDGPSPQAASPAVAPQSVVTSSTTAATEDIQEGVGWAGATLGKQKVEIESALGKPDSVVEFEAIRDSPASTFFDYQSKGIQVSFEDPTMKVKRVFFYGGCPKYPDYSIPFPHGTSKGVTWTSSLNEVLALYGEPAFDSAKRAGAGPSTTRRLDYGNVDFFFESDRLCRISVGNSVH